MVLLIVQVGVLIYFLQEGGSSIGSGFLGGSKLYLIRCLEVSIEFFPCGGINSGLHESMIY